MKTLQKYTNMAFLLLSVATIVPTYAIPTANEQEQIKQEETIVEPKKTKLNRYLQLAKDNKWLISSLTSNLALIFFLIDKKYNLSKNHTQLYDLIGTPITAMTIFSTYLLWSDEK